MNLNDLLGLGLPPQRLLIPLRPGVVAEVTLPRQMSENDWAQFWRVLETMKPALVRQPEATP